VRIPHLFHHDPDWKIVGGYRYDQCRCGARRTSRTNRSLISNEADGWPSLTDRHGVDWSTSGWCKAPESGWVSSGYPDSGITLMPSLFDPVPVPVDFDD
jgi:hypothetical protein